MEHSNEKFVGCNGFVESCPEGVADKMKWLVSGSEKPSELMPFKSCMSAKKDCCVLNLMYRSNSLKRSKFT